MAIKQPRHVCLYNKSTHISPAKSNIYNKFIKEQLRIRANASKYSEEPIVSISATVIQISAKGYLWSWLENQVLAAVKIIPLGQSSGQRALVKLYPDIDTAVATGLQIEGFKQMGSSLPALSMASSGHEIQYTRLFRS